MSFAISTLDRTIIDNAVCNGTCDQHWTFLGRGASKDVYAFDAEHVLKVDGKRDYYGNQVGKEIDVWQNASESDKQYLCPIVAHADDNINSGVMPWLNSKVSLMTYSIAYMSMITPTRTSASLRIGWSSSTTVIS